MWRVDVRSVVDTLYLCSGTIADPWAGEETGLGDELILMVRAV